MKTELYSVSKIFTERLLRIPDYQRGYSWTEKQVKDFWNDLVQLEVGKNHYTGVLTLEDVPPDVWATWEEDHWIIHSKGFSPFYVVDGQQRLTTTIILIQVILELITPGERLNYTSAEEIRKKFIFDSKDDGISRSYVFGYEKDNPSYEFLKTKIFLEPSENSFVVHETIYTHNLDRAKGFFRVKLKELDSQEVELLYKKLTQHFLFNIYSISEEIDVFVAFETMNNRGKPLSHLELLKNRLIYLSTRFDTEDYERGRLRHAVNESWKSIYHYLGKSKDNPLDDDVFLSTHFILYFGDEINRRADELQKLHGAGGRDYRFAYRRGMINSNFYSDFLLEVKFTARNVISETGTATTVTVPEVYRYVQSLKESVEIWYALLNPAQSNLSDAEKEWLEKLNRLSFMPVAPLVLVFFQVEKRARVRVRFLNAVERLLFVQQLQRYPGSYLEMLDSNVIDLSNSLKNGHLTAEKLIKDVEQTTDQKVPRPRIRSGSDLRPSEYDFLWLAWHSIFSFRI
jgi:uncharacterized protein with ParB-like and HNH nuclease domain